MIPHDDSAAAGRDTALFTCHDRAVRANRPHTLIAGDDGPAPANGGSPLISGNNRAAVSHGGVPFVALHRGAPGARCGGATLLTMYHRGAACAAMTATPS